MKNNFLKSSLLIGGIALISFTTSCSKDQPMADGPKIKKSGDSITLLVQNFITDYEDYLATESASETPSIEAQYAIWLAEAASNYQNSIDPEGETVYVDYSSPFSSTLTLDWAWSAGSGSEVLISEKDLYDFFTDVIEITDGKAPITDLNSFDNDDYTMSLSVKGMNLTTTQPSAIDPIGVNDHFTSVVEATCHPAFADGPGNAVTNSRNAADRISDAMGPYSYLSPPSPPAAIYGWYHSVTGVVNGTEEDLPWPLSSSLDFVTHTGYYNGSALVIQTVGTGTSQASKLWGAYEIDNNLTPRNRYECLSSTELISWKGDAQSLMQADATAWNGVILYHLGLEGFHSFTTSSAYHHLTFVLGKFSTHVD